jgi:hypothetical protein
MTTNPRTSVVVVLLCLISASLWATKPLATAQAISITPTVLVATEIFPNGVPASAADVSSRLGDPEAVDREQIEGSYFGNWYFNTLVRWHYPGYEFVFYLLSRGQLVLALTYVDWSLPTLQSLVRGMTREEVLACLGGDYYSYDADDMRYDAGQCELVLDMEGGTLQSVQINHIPH